MAASLPSEKFRVLFPEAVRVAGRNLRPGAERRYGGDERIAVEFPNDGGIECSLVLENKHLHPQCQCDAFAKGELCAHLWAALLLADAFGDLGKALKRSTPARLERAKEAPELQYENTRPSRHTGCFHDEEGRLLERNQEAPRPILHRKLVPAFDKSLKIDLIYAFRPDKSAPGTGEIVVDTWWRPTPAPGTAPLKLQPFSLEGGTSLPTAGDARQLATMAHHHQEGDPANRYRMPAGDENYFLSFPNSKNLRWADVQDGHIHLRELQLDLTTIGFPEIHIHQRDDAQFEVSFDFVTRQESIPFAELKLLADAPQQMPGREAPGYVLANSRLMRANLKQAGKILAPFVGKKCCVLDYPEAIALAKRMAMETSLDTTRLPEALEIQTITTVKPRGQLYVRTAKFKYQDKEQLHCELSFDYEGVTCPDDNAERIATKRAILQRSASEEEKLREQLRSLGFRYSTKAYLEEPGWKLLPAQLDNAVQQLVQDGWLVTAEGKTYRRPMTRQASVKSGMDWFELEGGLSFDGQEIPLPELLKAARNGQKAVRLDDGTYGLLPIDWLANFTVLTELGEVDCDGKLRFRMEQAALVASILQDRLEETTPRFQEQLAIFERLSAPGPAQPPEGFQATLRPYQSIGLGWLLNMQKAGLGACLADDMGLGKTIQVLAVLAGRSRVPGHGPSLIVMPRSLIFNWTAEAAKFAPWLRPYAYVGTGRDCSPANLAKYDLIFTTYGTLRNDATRLASTEFDYCVLDESQAIKTYDSSTARAARCVHARYRIAMTGTPIENNLGELFSQLDFLNPGLFGRNSIQGAPSPGNTKEDAPIQRIRRGVRPFLLRRTKQEVAKDLPPKTEQILWCEMPPEDKAEYDDLLKYYQNELAGQPATGSGMQTLAALMRLRQAACHPGLIKQTRERDSSAKLETLCANLTTILEAGHKALVFSQFTTFLKIIQKRLDEYGFAYCYLDGQTPDRQEQVSQFQNDPAKQVFLISLKAGGVGLNLTAADYVFLMDPWWNPATEAQAIDRAYRIGQTRPVMAYRIATRGTVEEKVIQLQNAKRELANAVINQDSGLPAAFTRKDLEELLK